MERLGRYLKENDTMSDRIKRESNDKLGLLSERKKMAKKILDNLVLTWHGANFVESRYYDLDNKNNPKLSDDSLRTRMMEDYSLRLGFINGVSLYPICGKDEVYIKIAGLIGTYAGARGCVKDEINKILQKILSRNLKQDEYEYLSQKSGEEIINDIFKKTI